MIKLTKLLLVLLFLLFTGCEDKPVTVIVDNSDYMKKMDPRLKAYPEAVEWYEDAEKYPEAAANLGYFYDETLKDYKEAIAWYKKAFNGGFVKASYNIGTVYVNLDDYSNAIKWYEISLSKDIEEAYYNLGYVYDIKIKNYSLAVKYYKIAIERESSIVNSLKNIAWLYHENLKDDVKASSYMINRIEYGSTKESIKSFLKNTWKLSDETIKKGYELQLTMPGLPRRYTGGI